MGARLSPARRPIQRQIQPLRQGDLDGLCGLYAIVNSLRALCPELGGQVDLDRLFAVLMRALRGRSDRPERFVTRGLGRVDLSHVLDAGLQHMAQRHDIALARHGLPAGSMRRCDIDRLWLALRQQLSTNCVAILGLAGSHPHWTVAVAMTPRTIRLLDSDGWQRLRRADCATPPARTGTVIVPRDVQFVRRDG